MILCGVDVGGTFTDLVLADLESGLLAIHKVPTVSHDPSHGVMTGLAELCARENVGLEAVDHVYHGTTIATNTMLEHNGAKTGLITSAGFRDILHIGAIKDRTTIRSCRKFRGRIARWFDVGIAFR